LYADVATDNHDDLVAGVMELVQHFIDSTAYLVIRSPPAAVVDNDGNSRDQTPCDEHDELLGVAQAVQDFIDTTSYLIVSSVHHQTTHSVTHYSFIFKMVNIVYV